MMRRAFLVMGMLACIASHGAHLRIDGNWWLNQSTDTKVGYVIGYQGGGMSQYIVCVTRLNSEHPACADPDSAPHSTNGQFMDGITQFYQDARNRAIFTYHAYQLVAAGIRGETTESIQHRTEQWRREDAQAE